MNDIPETYAKKLRSLEERQAADRDPEELADALHDGREKWSNLTLDQILTGYRRVIWPRLEAEGKDPETTIPTRGWLADIGHRNLEYALREYHDLTLSRFCRDYVGVEPEADSWEWPVDDAETLAQLADWEETQRTRLADVEKETTVRTRRSRLATYCRLYREEHGTDDLLAPLQDATDQRVATDMVVAVYDRLNERLSTTASKEKYHRTISMFYDFLVVGGHVAFNPTTGLIETHYGWSDSSTADSADVQPLSTEQIRRLYRAADSTTDRMLVLALGAWGLRRNEVAALHTSQLVLEPEEDAGGPYIQFDDRKNAAGTVALLYGVEAIRDRLAELADEWNDHTTGYLFPSTRSATGHIDGGTVYRRFGTLAERANVRLPNGEQPTPHNARKFWYTAYAGVIEEVAEQMTGIAEDQGSSDVGVVLRDYVDEATQRELRREPMRERLAEAFERSTVNR